jgi:hypothetical protein
MEVFSMNRKQTSKNISTLASQVLQNPRASSIQKSLAGSALSQSHTNKASGSSIESLAARALNSSKYSNVTKSLAGSVVSQSDKLR